MKKKGGERMRKRSVLIVLGLSLTILFFSVQGFAFPAIKCGEESEYTVYGFLRNNLGMFIDTQEHADTGNQLATARTWLRAYGDFKFSSQWRAWIATQAVWEPYYRYEKGNPTTENGGPQEHQRSRWKTYSEFDDINDVLREVYIESKPNPTTNLKVGRQIAIWGEALTTRVGDVVHPDDSRFAFGFSNLEDTRIPQYMIRGIHDIVPLSSSFEWIVMAPVVEGRYYVNRLPQFAQPAAGVFVEQRFAIYPEDRNVTLEGLPSGPIFIPMGDVREIYPDDGPGMRYGARTSTVIGGFQFGFSYFHTHSYDPMPSIGATRMYIPAAALGIPAPIGIPLGDYSLVHPYMDIVGFSMNKQLPWPGVIRAEAVYSPNKPFNTFNVGTAPVMTAFGPAFTPYEDGIVRRDWVKYMIAYDLSGFFYPSWHKTAPIDVTLEHIGEWVPNSRELQFAIYNTKQPNYHAGFNVRVSTNWFYNKVATDVIVGYDTFGDSGVFMPGVKWTPSWQNEALSFELRYIGIYGDSDYEAAGIFRKKDFVLLTTQFNF
jgi:hypothetical protein